MNFLSEEEKHDLLVTFNGPEVVYPKGKTIVDLFEDQVEKTPDAIAVVFEDTELTYQELNERSNRLAHYLQTNYEIHAGDLVAIKQERTEWTLISVLGVLKSSGAYVAIDPNYPKDRIDFIEKDTGCKVCLDETELSKFQENETDYSKEPVTSNIESDTLAYVIYTSGSTGIPKGVMITHQNVYSFIQWSHDEFSNSDFDEVLFTTSINFDLSVFEMFHPLTSGKSLRVLHDGLSISEHVNTDKKLLINTVPSVVGALLQEEMNFDSVSVLNMAGEPIPSSYRTQLEGKVPEIRNLYGPSEDTTYTTVFRIDNDQRNLIGKPISNTQIYILSERKGLQPIGVIGEICISGAGLAKGYLNREELTNEKFVANPFKEGERLYKTGDLGRWLPDGNIEFLGRKDDQVKIRGYRIELGEIEHALSQHEAVNQTIVLAKENEADVKELVAYITSNEEQNTNDLRSFLKGFLPEYMIPGHFVQLDEMPLTPNGKVDKKALPDPEGVGMTSGVEYVAPTTEREKALVAVWSDVLKREGIGINDSFYNLGGDSIKSIQVVARLKQRGYGLKVEHILKTPVVKDLALLMELTTRVVDQKEVTGIVELTPVQHWFFDADEIKVHNHFNQSVLLQSKEAIDPKALEKSITDLTLYHDALRMSFTKRDDGTWEQRNRDTKSKSFTVDFFDLTEADDAIEQISKLGEDLHSTINLSEGPLFKVAHFRLKDGDRLGLIIHHLVVDGVSWRILLEDFSNLYTSYKAGKTAEKVVKTDSFKRWASLQKEYSTSDKLKKERAYWEELCSQEVESLPLDEESTENSTIIDSVESFHLDKTITELLQTRVHGVYRTEINDVLLTGLGLAIKEVLNVEKSVLKMEGHGREEILDGVDISRTVGWFTTMYPFILDIPKSSSPIESLVNVKGSLRSIPNKGIGYGILKYLSNDGLESTFTPELVFNYLGDFGTNANNDEDALFQYASESLGADSAQENRTEVKLDVAGILVKGELSMSIRYSSSSYNESTVKNLAASYQKHLTSLVKELAKDTEVHLTPSDLSFKGLSVEELSKLNSDNMVEDVYELSPLQEGIYFHWLSNDSKSLYFEQVAYKIQAEGLEIDKLRSAYEALIARHGVLRTQFSNDYAGRPLQIVKKQVKVNFTFESINGQQDKQAYIAEIKQKDRQKGFDLANPSQMRLKIIEVEDGVYEFIWSHHHILMDGWCVSVLINDFNLLLGTETMGETPSLPEVKPYANYINWLRRLDKGTSLSHWSNYLSGYEQTARVPFQIKSKNSNYVESTQELNIEESQFKKLDALCTKLGITHNTFVQGVWGFLLSRYNNTNDVVFGTVVSGRSAELDGVEDMIGLFSNTIPVRVQFEAESTPITMLQALQEQSIQSTPHHYMSLSEVQSQSDLGMDLMDHILIFENYAMKELEGEGLLNSSGDDGLVLESMEVFEQNNYDFHISVLPDSSSLKINLKFNSNCYEKTGIERLVTQLDQLVDQFINKADQPLGSINYFSEFERQELLISFNDNSQDYPRNCTIIDLFEQQVEKTPDAIALSFDETQLTYRQLDEQSNQLANYLLDNYNVKLEDLVGIKQERSEWLVISLLGVLKTGAAYVPIDPNYPLDRIKFIESDTALKISLDAGELDEFKKIQSDFSKKRPNVSITEKNLVYVIYTSGSTGEPKGVMLEHANLVSFTSCFDLGNARRIAASTNITFDISGLEIWSALCFGRELVMLSNSELDDPYLYLKRIESANVDTIQLTPSRFSQIQLTSLNLPECVSLVLVGGEKMSESLFEDLKQESFRAINVYGPTETTIWSTSLDLGNSDELSIGSPLPNEQVYILNEENELQPIGAIGEMCIGGSGVARGYLNQESLTSQKFIPNPFNEGENLYKTGDLGRWLESGSIEFVGRKDDQVKIRGYRIELGEIEHALMKMEGVEQVVVQVKENRDGEQELLAYMLSDKEQNTTEIRSFLKSMLPSYMIPGYFIQLEKMPLSPSGKINRKAFPNLEDLELNAGTEFQAPRNVTEEKLTDIWKRVLEIENVSVKADFFTLGGNSLKAIRLINEYQKELGIKLSVKQIFTDTTLESHGALIDKSTKTDHLQIEKIEEQESYPISVAQKRLWVLSQFEASSAAYNMPFRMTLNGEYNIDNFKKAIYATIDRHEILRTVFKKDNEGELKQWVLKQEDLNFQIGYKDFCGESNKEERVESFIKNDMFENFDLAKGPLFRASLLQIKSDEYIFYFNMHHIISDGWSMEVLSNDVFAFYDAFEAARAPELEELRIQYKDYSAWQANQFKSESFQKHRAYWLNQLSQEIDVVDLPSSKSRPTVKTVNGQAIRTFIGAEISDKLKKYSKKNGGSLFMGLLTTWNALIHRYTDLENIVIGTPVAGRDHSELEGQIGFYLNMLPMLNKVDSRTSFNELYESVKETALSAYAHQMYPFDSLVEDLNVPRDTSRSVLFDVSITYHNDEIEEEIPNLDEKTIQKIELKGSTKVRYDIELHFQEIDDCFSFGLIYNEDVYDQEFMMQLMKHFKQLLGALLDQPQAKLGTINYLTEDENYTLQHVFNDTEVDYPNAKTIATLFEEQASLNPNHVALVFDDRELTYQQLNDLSNQLAHCLREEHNVKSKDLVGVQLERNEWLIVTLLGILKTGAAYVPIDPSFPSSRKEHIAEDTALSLLITEAGFVFDIDFYQGDIFAIDVEFEPSNYSSEEITSDATSRDLAYIIYTSGSTGKPKGVMVEQHSVVRLVKNTNFTGTNGEDRILGLSNVVFDGSIFDIFMPLLNGGTLILAEKNIFLELSAFDRLVDKYDVEGFFTTTVLFNALVDAELPSLGKVKYILFGGEQVSVSHVTDFKKLYPSVNLHHVYGPTENTTYSTWYEIPDISPDAHTVPIGNSIANSTSYVLNEFNLLQPIGVEGEICVGGAGLARGYLNKDVLTKQKFVDHPFMEGERIYRTGDVGKRLADGSIEFVGRNDNQVKIRGYRIELGEIEHVIVKKEHVEQVVVLANETPNGSKELMCYIVAREAQTAGDIRYYLQSLLPEYMIPSRYQMLDQMPMNQNGKIDKGALTKLQGDELTSAEEYVAPSTETETVLTDIWKDILQMEKIGVKDNFFAIGGDSMKTIQLVNQVKKALGMQLKVADVYKNHTIAQLGSLLDNGSISKHSEDVLRGKEIIEAFKDKLSNDVQSYESIGQVEDFYPVSPVEKGMIFSSMMTPQEPIYYDQFVYSLSISDVEKFREALSMMMERHTILRTKYFMNAFSEPVKVILSECETPLFINDFSSLEQEEAAQKVHALTQSLLDHRLSFDNELLWTLYLNRIKEDQYLVIFSFHHAMLDGWSSSVFRSEMSQILASDNQLELPAIRSTYKDYTAGLLGRQDSEETKAFWINHLEGYTRNKLPFNYKGTRVVEGSGMKEIRLPLASELLEQVEDLANTQQVSVKAVFLAAHLYLLHVLSTETDVVTGVVTHSRPEIEDSEKLMGCFLYTIPMRVNFQELEHVKTLLDFTQNYLIDVKPHEVHLTDIIKYLDEKATNENPIFDTLMNFTDFYENDNIQETEIVDTIDALFDENSTVSNEMTNTFFDLEVDKTSERLAVKIKYVPSYFHISEIEYALSIYVRILNVFIEDADQKLRPSALIQPEDYQSIMQSFNDTIVEYSEDKSLFQLFEDQVKRTPDGIALRHEGNTLSYGELNAKSNQLARSLVNSGVQPGDNIGLIAGRNFDMIVGMFGILKAGGAYVPIDPVYPVDRQQYIIQNSGVKSVITDESYDIEKELSDVDFTVIDDKLLSSYGSEDLSVEVSVDQLAYTIYTSGSTGRPKGVMITHRSAVNLVEWVNKTYQVGPSDRLLFITSMCFDLSVYDIFGTLSVGGVLVIAQQEDVQDINRLKNLLTTEKITFWDSVPTTMNYLVGELKIESELFQQTDLRLVFMSGDWIPVQLPDSIKTYFPNAEVISLGGATEGTVWSNYFPIDKVEKTWSSIPYGKPIANNFFYILNDQFEQVPYGTAGELFIGGIGVAQGYANDIEKTSYSYVKDPFNSSLGGMMYRTGDLGRMLPDGNMEFLGRKDHQVKIRGFRVELGEIESTLLKHPEISSGVVNLVSDSSNNNELCAYYVADQELNVQGIRNHLKESLPIYMVPTYFIRLDKLPLTSNGKIDRKALPAITEADSSGKEYIAPTSELEVAIADIWQSLLGVDKIGVHDDWFEIGANSLHVGAFINRVHKTTDLLLNIQEVFSYATIYEIVQLLNSKEVDNYDGIEQVSIQESYAISDAQRRLWVLSQFEGESASYNMPSILHLDGPYNLENFKKAIFATIDRHEILRTVFREDAEGEIRQWIQPTEALDFNIEYLDYRNVLDAQDRVKQYTTEDSFVAFDLEKGPLLRAALIHLEDEKYVFYYNMHHIISDAWSLEVLAKDVQAYYESFEENREPQIDDLRIQYKDYSAWQLDQLTASDFDEHRAYWLKKLNGDLQTIDLPRFKERPTFKTNQGRSLGTYFSEVESEKLKQFAQENGGSLFIGLIASLNAILRRYTNQNDLILGTPIAARDHIELENQIGFYLNTLVLRNDISGKHTFHEVFAKVKGSTLEAYDHQRYPFDRLVEELDLARDTSRSALFDVMVTLQNAKEGVQPDSSLDADGIVDLGEGLSKFDIDISFQEVGNQISYILKYNTDIYDAEVIEQFMRHHKNLLSELLKSPNESISEINYLTEDEVNQLQVDFNSSIKDYQSEKTLVDLFEAQVAKAPNSIAVVHQGVSLTYQQLNEEANQLSNYLQTKYAVKQGQLIGLKLDRSEQLIVAILGVLKSTGAYLPIDPKYPTQRIDYILGDSQCELVIDQQELSTFYSEKDEYSTAKSEKYPTPNDLAYVIYTSGSTGNPKGVMVEHTAAVSFFENLETTLGINPAGVFAATTNYTFDISVLELLGTLTLGATVNMISTTDPSYLLEQIENGALDGLQLTPSRLTQLLELESGSIEKLESLEVLLVGGEALSENLYEKLKTLQTVKVVNVYGPTEATIWSSSLSLKESGSLSIGKPLFNEQIYVLDEYQQLAPIGVLGELCIGGDGLAKGYINNEALTAEKFVENPLDPKGRIYRTGDVGRWLPDGNLQCVGRLDDQVKIRGHRIELGEIEHALLKNEQIESAVVIAKENQTGEKELVAYLTSKEELNVLFLRTELGKVLPDSMVPSFFIQLEKLPLNSSGKIDKQALKNLDAQGVDSGVNYVAPRNAVEESLVNIWSETLQIDKDGIGIDEGFFHLGGNSIQMIKLRSKLEKEFGKEISITALFQNATIRSQANLVLGDTVDAKLPEEEMDKLVSMLNKSGDDKINNDVAVIGMAIRAPGSKNVFEFWDNLKNGVESIRHYTEEELESLGVSKLLLKNKNYVRAGSYVENKDCFDSAFFGYIPDEASLMDPQTRIFHEVVWSALEDAGYDPIDYKGMMGLYAGASANIGWQAYAKISNQGKLDDFAAKQLGNKDFLPTLLAYKLNLRGAVHTIDTACSTSLVAIHRGVRSLLTGENNMVIAGGVSIFSTKSEYGYLGREGTVHSVDGHNRTFDESASGTVGGEGAGAVILKRLDDAIRDGDNIHAVIKGSAINNDGNRKAGFTAPSIDGQSEAISIAHKVAGVPSSTIGYVEAHGTATKLGDPIEVEALSQVFGKNNENYCALGSVKSNIGHLDAAAGVAGFIKTVLCLKNKRLVPSLHFKRPNPEINFEESSFYVNTELKEWLSDSAPLRAGVSSFGIGGTNAHLVLEEAPGVRKSDEEEDLKLLTLSAKSIQSIDNYGISLTDFLVKTPEVNLSDLCYSLQTGRREFDYRKYLTFSNREELLEKLKSELPLQVTTNVAESPVVNFMFPGAGSQYVNMGADLYKENEFFREQMNLGFSLLKKITGFDYHEILFPTNEGDLRVNEMLHAQPLIFLFDYATAKLLISLGVHPDYMIGHSIGEYAAACISGVFGFEDALKLVVRRGELMDTVGEGRMVSVACTKTNIQKYLNDSISIAAINGAEQIVLSGKTNAVEKLIAELEDANEQFIVLHASVAGHSAMMDDILAPYAEDLSKVKMSAPEIPFMSGVTGELIPDEQAKSIDYWTSHMRKTVNFHGGLKGLSTANANGLFIECGAGHALSSLVKQLEIDANNYTSVNLVRTIKENENDLEYLYQSIGELWSLGLKINWESFYGDKERSKISLPHYSFEQNKFPMGENVFDEIFANSSGQSGLSRNSEDLKDWLYYPIWKTSVPTGNTLKEEMERTFLVFSPSETFSKSLNNHFEGSGIRLIHVSKSLEFQKNNESGYQVNEIDQTHFDLLFNDLKENERITDVVYAWNLELDTTNLQLSKDNEEIHSVYFSLAKIIQKINEVFFSDELKVNVLTSSLYKVLGSESVNHSQSLTMGLVNVIPQEYGIPCRNIDIDFEDYQNEHFATVADELVNGDEFDRIVAFRLGMRWVQDYQINKKPVETDSSGAIKEGGVYLITGGLGNIGMVLSEHLISKYNAELLLVGRKELPDGFDPNQQNDEEWLNRLSRLKNMSNKVNYMTCDVSNLEEFSAVVGRAEDEIGAIQGVIHAAGTLNTQYFELIEETSYENTFEVIRAKFEGINNLYSLFHGKDLDFVWITSSLASVIAGLRSSAYSAANLYLDHFIISKSKELPNWKCIGLSEMVFTEEDINNEMTLNRQAMIPEEIFRLFEWSSSLEKVPVILETAEDLNRRISRAFFAHNKEQESEDEFEIANIQKKARPNLKNVYVAPASNVEIQLTEMVENFLGTESVGIEDNFFELGGDSLKAMVFINKIYKEYNIKFSIAQFIENPNIKGVAQEIEGTMAVEKSKNEGRKFDNEILI